MLALVLRKKWRKAAVCLYSRREMSIMVYVSYSNLQLIRSGLMKIIWELLFFPSRQMTKIFISLCPVFRKSKQNLFYKILSHLPLWLPKFKLIKVWPGNPKRVLLRTMQLFCIFTDSKEFEEKCKRNQLESGDSLIETLYLTRCLMLTYRQNKLFDIIFSI